MKVTFETVLIVHKRQSKLKHEMRLLRASFLL